MEIRHGEFVVFQLIKNIPIYKCVELGKSKSVKLGEFRFVVDDVTGQAYGSLFEIRGNKLFLKNHKDSETESFSKFLPQSQTDLSNSVSDNGNKDHQELSQEAVVEMRASGISGKTIVDTLIQHSKSFESKPKYTQEKYIRKKEQKYVPLVRVTRPSCRLLSEIFYSQSPPKICGLRPDSFAQILSISNVQSGSLVLVVESCRNLVVVGVLERLSGAGTVLNLVEDVNSANKCQFSSFGLTSEQTTPLKHVNLRELLASAKCTQRDPTIISELKSVSATASQNSPECSPMSKRPRLSEMSSDKSVIETYPGVLDQGLQFDSLIIVSKLSPVPLLLPLMELLKPSRPFVVFSFSISPLIECCAQLRSRFGSIPCLKLSESLTRPYQVLPGRTHPSLQDQGHSGYILSGLSVLRQECHTV